MYEFFAKWQRQSKTLKAREKAFSDFSINIFPYGEVQQRKITCLLNALFPKEREKFILLYYILLKDTYLKQQEFDQAFQTMKRKKIISETAETKSIVRALLDIDCQIDETLDYPTMEELIRVSRKSS